MKSNTTTMTVKGQVTVPVAIRRKLGLMPSDRLRVREVKGSVVLQKDDYWVQYEQLQKKVQSHRKTRGITPLSVEEIEKLRDQSWSAKA